MSCYVIHIMPCNEQKQHEQKQQACFPEKRIVMRETTPFRYLIAFSEVLFFQYTRALSTLRTRNFFIFQNVGFSWPKAPLEQKDFLFYAFNQLKIHVLIYHHLLVCWYRPSLGPSLISYAVLTKSTACWCMETGIAPS